MEVEKRYNLRFSILRDQKKKIIRGVQCKTDEEKRSFYKLFGDNTIAPDAAFDFPDIERPEVKFTQKETIILTFNTKQSADYFESKLVTSLKDPTTSPNNIKGLASKNEKNWKI